MLSGVNDLLQSYYCRRNFPMFTLLALAITVIGGRFLVKRYERHLDTQLGPWIVGELQPQRSHLRRSRDPR
jgi:hypothetical protein